MKSIIIGFSSPKKSKIGATLIKWWIRKPYSHVYARYTDDQGRDLVFHAAHGLVHLVTYDNFLKDNEVIVEYKQDCTKEEYQAFRDYYYSKLGQPYSYKAIVLMPLYDLGILKKAEDDPGYICSELVGEMEELVFGVKLPKPKNVLEPQDIEDLIKWLLPSTK